MKTMKQFTRENKVRISVEWADQNKLAPDWKDANHYKVTLRRGGKQFTTYYSMGYGHTSEPTAEDVLNAVAMDSVSVENARSFEEWAMDYGYDPDGRKAERLYKTCERQAEKVKRFLGEDLYNDLLWNTESL